MKWKINNHLNDFVHIYVNGKNYINFIKPKSLLIIDSDTSNIHLGDDLFFIRDNEGMIDEPVKLTYADIIDVGDYGYSKGSRGRVSTGDLRGVRINNYLPHNINIYYKGGISLYYTQNKLVACIGAYNEKYSSHFGGSSHSLYFDNARHGLNIGDVIIVKNAQTNETIYEIPIHNQFIKEIYIGKNIVRNSIESNPKYGRTGKYHSTDNYVYRLRNDNITDLKHYI